MQKFPLRKNDILGWRRLKGDFVPANQIWMVLNEESDISPSNSKLDNSVKKPDNFVSNSTLESKEMNCSSSLDTKLYNDNRLSEENYKLQSKIVNNFDSEDLPKNNECKTEMDGQILFTYSRITKFSQKRENNLRWENNNDNDEQQNADDESTSNFFRWENTNDNDKQQNADDESTSKSFRKGVLDKSVYDFVSESESENNVIDGQRYTYSRKSSFSHLVKGKRNSKWESSNDDDDDDEKETDDIFNKNSRKKFKVNSKPKKDLIDKAGNKLKDINNQTYFRKSRVSHLLKSKRNSRKESSSDDEIFIKNSKKRLKVINSKPNKELIDMAGYTLKDLKDQRNSEKRKLINYSTTAENSEKQNIRSSNRERKIVNYAEDGEEEYKSDSDSEYVEENESEDENRNKMTKKVESSDIVKTSQMSTYEQMVERNKEANRRMLEEMGILQAKKDLQAKNELVEHKKKREYVKKNSAEPAEIRRSQRMKLEINYCD